jgi:hypothetical protein
MNYSTLEDVYGTPFDKRVPITQQRKDVHEVPLQKEREKEKEEFTNKNTEKTKSMVESIQSSIGYDTSPVTENFRVDEEPVRRTTLREKFTGSQPANMVTDFDQSEKISRILRLIEQNRTGYERPAMQDMLLYIATGVFFLFTFDTFVMLGKSMGRRK